MSLIITFQLMLFSQFIHRALGNKWSGTYSPEHLCALKGSTVFMNGSYRYPTGVRVIKACWLIDPVQGKQSIDLRNESGYSDRVEYLGDEQNHFTLRLSDVKKTDEHQYCIRVLGQKSKQQDKYLFYPGVRLNVTELKVEIPEKVVEGNQTVLVCNTTCSLSHTPAFIWYRNGLRINNSINYTLILQPTRADDAASYSCAVRGYEEHRSPAGNLTVMYPPKNVSVSISPSGEIVEGSSVTLTCSSDANPPVEIYTWFKETSLIGNEKTFTISKMSFEDRGVYKCKCSNEVGHQYSTVRLYIGGVSVILYVSVGVGLFGLAALLSTLFWLRWKRQKKKADEGDYQNAGPSAKDDTYAALDPTGRTSDDVYQTLTVRVS